MKEFYILKCLLTCWLVNAKHYFDCCMLSTSDCLLSKQMSVVFYDKSLSSKEIYLYEIFRRIVYRTYTSWKQVFCIDIEFMDDILVDETWSVHKTYINRELRLCGDNSIYIVTKHFLIRKLKNGFRNIVILIEKLWESPPPKIVKGKNDDKAHILTWEFYY